MDQPTPFIFNVRFQLGRKFTEEELTASLINFSKNQDEIIIKIWDNDSFEPAFQRMKAEKTVQTQEEIPENSPIQEINGIISKAGSKGTIHHPNGHICRFTAEYVSKTPARLEEERIAHQSPATPEELERLNEALGITPDDWDGTYPVRCEIIDVTNQEVLPGVEGNTPTISQPHVGKRGTAQEIEEFRVKITLDDKTILYGEDCWWKPLPNLPILQTQSQ